MTGKVHRGFSSKVDWVRPCARNKSAIIIGDSNCKQLSLNWKSEDVDIHTFSAGMRINDNFSMQVDKMLNSTLKQRNGSCRIYTPYSSWFNVAIRSFRPTNEERRLVLSESKSARSRYSKSHQQKKISRRMKFSWLRFVSKKLLKVVPWRNIYYSWYKYSFKTMAKYGNTVFRQNL